ncbi:uncharacterized protein K02A2.6-like [Uranotaenia lowii]|uniref:uncharacterized protein K02A2.6-like n=2 Tax=Uranotaenia lowii TaxID=190385 RepID=UPI00247A9101|nr:uncharacterized protein K02A2.6-like [Uranotaenia lowii]
MDATTSEVSEEKDQMIRNVPVDDAIVNCRVGSSEPISFLVDSGADVNVIGGNDWKCLESEYNVGSAVLKIIHQLDFPELRAYATKCPMKIKTAFEAVIEVIGAEKPVIKATFLVIPEGNRSLLGRDTSSKMKLLKVGLSVNVCSSKSNTAVFPKMPGVKVKFTIDESVLPVKNAYFNVPAAFREAARQRLSEMEARGIIERVLTAPTWISGMSAIPKGKEDFRLVVNMRAPNKAIKREYFRLPLINEMRTKLHGAQYFAKLDLTSAYYHLELAKESRDLTTFLSENGMYRFTRLMFGVNCAPEIFQREMSRIFEGLEGIIIYIDDILVFADTIKDLRLKVAQVLGILKANNLTVNQEKCEFDKQRITFLGHLLDKHGFHIDESKINHVRKFREPKSASELRSFLGLASFVSAYIKNFADITSPLWSVANEKTWSWGPVHSKAFEQIKKNIVESTVALGYFCEVDKTILYTDASPIALGAVLVQESAEGERRIISFGSKALTPTEKRYAQHQREALAAVWAVEHFSYFLLGRHFTLKTDAKGVSFILNRSREDSKRALTRADGWALRLSPYSYEVEFVKGRENIADPSSRLYVGTDEPFSEESNPWELAVLETSNPQFLTNDEISKETSRDETLAGVLEALKSDIWSTRLRRFDLVKAELYEKNGLLYKGGCVVIPKCLQEKTLNIAHSGHPSAAKLKSILRERVWWPGIPSDAENWVNGCKVCAANGRPEKPTPMKRIPAPKNVWETIGIDFNGPYAHFGGIYILVVVDYRSRFLIAKVVKSTNFDQTKKVLDDIFGRDGFPDCIKSDNGPPFNGAEYKLYCRERGIQTVYSTPLFPQQNGMVENYMKLINKAMSAAIVSKTNFHHELQAAVESHNAAKHRVTKLSPEEVMLRRKVKRGLPLMNRGVIHVDDQLLDKVDYESKLKAKQREDIRRGARQCSIKPGDHVIVERLKKTKGDTRFSLKRFTVLSEDNGKLRLTDETGNIMDRHVSQTKKVHNWRDEESEPSNSECLKESVVEPLQRPVRDRKKPSHLRDYVDTIERKDLQM